MVREDRSVYRRAWEILTVNINERFDPARAKEMMGDDVIAQMQDVMKVSLDQAVKEYQEQSWEYDKEIVEDSIRREEEEAENVAREELAGEDGY